MKTPIPKRAIGFRCPPVSRPGRRHLFFVLLGVVLGEEVVAKVTFEIAEHGVDVVGVILGVIEFDEEGRALDAVVGCGATVERAGPRKRDLV